MGLDTIEINLVINRLLAGIELNPTVIPAQNYPHHHDALEVDGQCYLLHLLHHLHHPVNLSYTIWSYACIRPSSKDFLFTVFTPLDSWTFFRKNKIKYKIIFITTMA